MASTSKPFFAAVSVAVVAIYIGFGFANRLVAPIRDLIGASDRVARGDLDQRHAAEREPQDAGGLALFKARPEARGGGIKGAHRMPASLRRGSTSAQKKGSSSV